MILNRQRRIPLAVKPLARFSERVRRELGFPEESVTICFVSDPAIARIESRISCQTRTHRCALVSRCGEGDDSPGTALRHGSAKQRRGNDYIGDIVISPETARRYARRSILAAGGGAARADLAWDDSPGRLRPRESMKAK